MSRGTSNPSPDQDDSDSFMSSGDDLSTSEDRLQEIVLKRDRTRLILGDSSSDVRILAPTPGFDLNMTALGKKVAIEMGATFRSDNKDARWICNPFIPGCVKCGDKGHSAVNCPRAFTYTLHPCRYCNGKHHISACIMIQTLCPRCQIRGHFPYVNCPKSFEFEDYRDFFELHADYHPITKKRFWDPGYGFFAFPPTFKALKNKIPISYKELLKLPVRDALDKIRDFPIEEAVHLEKSASVKTPKERVKLQVDGTKPKVSKGETRIMNEIFPENNEEGAMEKMLKNLKARFKKVKKQRDSKTKKGSGFPKIKINDSLETI